MLRTIWKNTRDTTERKSIQKDQMYEFLNSMLLDQRQSHEVQLPYQGHQNDKVNSFCLWDRLEALYDR